VGEQLGEIRLPPAKIIIHIDGWNADLDGPAFQRGDEE
jgi:hypothetical protein